MLHFGHIIKNLQQNQSTLLLFYLLPLSQLWGRGASWGGINETEKDRRERERETAILGLIPVQPLWPEAQTLGLVQLRACAMFRQQKTGPEVVVILP